MALRLYRAAEVCELTELQPYVLRSWEKEFPGIGLQRTPGSTRLYRQADVDQVLKIKQLVFGEGLTVAGARRRLQESEPLTMSESELAEFAPVPSQAQSRIAAVREGLKMLRGMLDASPAADAQTVPAVDEGRAGNATTAHAGVRKVVEPKRRRASA